MGVLLVLALLAGAWFAARALLFTQQDDAQHLEAKRRYLETLAAHAPPAAPASPDIVLVLFDDLGYGDLGATGSPVLRTPHIDTLARDGVVLEQFYAPAAVCSPSRAGFLTGRLPARAGMPEVTFPSTSPMQWLMRARGVNVRLPAEEITLAEVLRARGYRTGMVGKWHLGDASPSLPNDMGFAHFYGALYSNDQQPFALYRDSTVEVEAPADQRELNAHYEREARAFIAAADERPFFLYFAHNFPHVPLHVAPGEHGRSAGGLYGDVVEALDRSIGALVAELEAAGRLQNTLILVSSDNGPWFQGSAGRLRGRKGSSFEGGMRVPMIVHWPARIPGERRLADIAMGTDWFPTVLDWLGVPLPQDRVIDGRSLRALLEGDAPGPHDQLFLFAGEELMAVREQRFKYRADAPYGYVVEPSSVGLPIPQAEWLFDTVLDEAESYDTALRHPEALQRLRAAWQARRAEHEQNPRGWIRPPDPG